MGLQGLGWVGLATIDLNYPCKVIQYIYKYQLYMYMGVKHLQATLSSDLHSWELDAIDQKYIYIRGLLIETC